MLVHYSLGLGLLSLDVLTIPAYVTITNRYFLSAMPANALDVDIASPSDSTEREGRQLNGYHGGSAGGISRTTWFRFV